ncbi:MAG: lytic transglycosylase domain-containing protein [Bacteroidota bacterium]
MSIPTDLRSSVWLLCFVCCLYVSTARADCLQNLDYLSECLAPEDQPYLAKAHYRYTVSGQREMAAMLATFPTYHPVLLAAIRAEELPDWLAYLPLAESRLTVNARSKAGAAGLWQLMPATARGLGLRVDRNVDERLDIYKSSRAAARYLKQLHRQFDDWLLALAAYNCGAGNVRKAQRRSGGYFYHEISTYLPGQTRRYLPRVITSTKIAQRPYWYGFATHHVPEKVLLRIDRPLELATIATAYGLSVRALKRENPAYNSSAIPMSKLPATLQLPTTVETPYPLIPWRVPDKWSSWETRTANYAFTVSRLLRLMEV